MLFVNLLFLRRFWVSEFLHKDYVVEEKYKQVAATCISDSRRSHSLPFRAWKIPSDTFQAT